MAGHSKFKNIMHRKGAQDAKRAKVFAKFGRELMVAAKLGGDDPDMNPRLRTALAAAKAGNMPKDNIERAIKKGAGGGEDTNFEEMRYEGYGSGGVAFIVEALTDNRNRTASEVRTIFAKNGGNLAETGSVTFMFEQVGELIYPCDVCDGDTMFEAAVEAGAENIESDDENHRIVCAPDQLNDVRDHLEKLYGEAQSSSLQWDPKNTVDVDHDTATKMFRLIDALEDNDDVQKVFANFEPPEDFEG